jgi:hypothetical protein
MTRATASLSRETTVLGVSSTVRVMRIEVLWVET